MAPTKEDVRFAKTELCWYSCDNCHSKWAIEGPLDYEDIPDWCPECGSVDFSPI